MNSYNNTIVPKIADFVEYIVNKLEDTDNEGRKVKLLKYTVVETDSTDLDTLRVNERTESFSIILKFEITKENGEVEIQDAELSVPKMINNVFIIEGKTRIPTSTLDNDSSCRVYHDNININENISVEYWKDTDEGNWKFLVHTVDYKDEDLTFDGFPDNFEKFKEYLKLSREEILKLQCKLDVDKVDEYLTYNILKRLADLGPDMARDSIIDKKITTTEENLIRTLYRRNTRKKILTNTKRKFYRYGIVYMTDIQNAITRYFKVADEKTIDIPSKVNPLVFDALRYKITIPKNIAYNQSFTDIVDVVNTPENNNVNRLNELNICGSVENGVMYITCYEFKTGNKVKLEYLEYVNKIVLTNECYDYKTKKVKELSEYTYKLRLNTYKVKTLKGLKIDLIEPSPDEKLSLTTRRIPLINMSDSVRVAMGASMSKQAIEVYNSEPSLISSGNDDEDYINSSLTTKYVGRNPAIVEFIDGDKIFYRDEVTGSVAYYQVSAPTIGANDSLISFTPVVKPGDRLEPGSIVITPTILKNNSYDLGVNTFVFYMSYLGFTYEDGIVISESYAKRLTHYSTIDVSMNIKGSDIIKYIKKVGSKVTSKDILINLQTKLRGRSSTNKAYLDNKGVMGFLGLEYNQNNLITPNNVDEGYIVDVLIQENKEVPLESEYSQKVINEYSSSDIVNEYMTLPEKYRSLKCIPSDVDPRFSYVITFKIVKVNPVKKGDKLCNRWGSKGIVSLILPDNEMPYRESDGKRAEMLLNPAAVISRKNPSQLYEVALTKIILAIYNKVTELINSGNIEAAKEFTVPYYEDKYTKMSDDEFLANHKKGILGYGMKVGSYAKVNYDQVIGWLKEFNIEEAEYITSPVLGEIEAPVITGDSYMFKLYHAADYVGKVTSSVVDTKEPYMGRGVYRDEGQKIGEMELWALLSYGTEDFIRTGKSDMLRSQYAFLNELLLAGYVMNDNKGVPYLSQYRKKLRDLVEENQ